MSQPMFFGILALVCSLGPVVVIPKLYETKHFHLGCIGVCIFCILYVVLADPRDLSMEVKAWRGLMNGATVVILGRLFIWLKKRYSNLL